MSHTTTTQTPDGADQPEGDPPALPDPGERRLAHPPSDRYRDSEARAAIGTAPDPGASVARGVAIATVAATLCSIAIVVLGGVFAVSAGLVAVAGATGWGVAALFRYGAGDHMTRRGRVAWTTGLSVAAIGLGQLGLWQYARTEGGVLPLIEYLDEVFGPLVPLEFGAAGLLAWLAAR